MIKRGKELGLDDGGLIAWDDAGPEAAIGREVLLAMADAALSRLSPVAA
jgi:hypothetical protein